MMSGDSGEIVSKDANGDVSNWILNIFTGGRDKVSSGQLLVAKKGK